MIHSFSLEKLLVVFFTLMVSVWIFYPGATFANDRVICEEIARKVEIENNLPKNILTSISLVEAGRKHDDGVVKSWPWSLNHAGKSLFFATKETAVEYLTKNITPKFKNIDVGCMQINVRWHRENFRSLSTMIDPRQNIDYAAEFLTNLKSVHGSWEKAIKHYHSATPKLNVKYYAKVQQAWSHKTKNNPLVQTASLSLDNKIVYPSTKPLELDYTNFDPYPSKANDQSAEELIDFSSVRLVNAHNDTYSDPFLIENEKVDENEELRRYIKLKSAYLEKKIDMILLFREEFSKN